MSRKNTNDHFLIRQHTEAISEVRTLLIRKNSINDMKIENKFFKYFVFKNIIQQIFYLYRFAV